MSNRSIWLVELTPAVCTVILLWWKQVYFVLALAGPSFLATSKGEQTNFLSATAALSSALLPAALMLLLPRLPRYCALWLLNLTLTTLILGDIVSMRFYGDILSFLRITPLRMVRQVLPSIQAQLVARDALLYADLFAALILLPWYGRVSRRLRSTDPRHMRRLTGFAAGIAVLLLIPFARLLTGTEDVMTAYRNLRHELPTRIGLVPYHALDVWGRVREHPRAPTKADVDYVSRFMRDLHARDKPRGDRFGIARGTNLILISAESLNSFGVGLRIVGQPVTPRLDAFARESLQFTNFYDQTHLGTTSDAEFISLNSLHPITSGTVVFRYLGNNYDGLPAVLARHGYQTLSAAGEPADFWNMEIAHKRYGFSRSFFDQSYPSTERINGWVADRPFLIQTAGLLRAQKEPFMAFMITSSSHHPFTLPAQHRTLAVGPLEGTIVGRYLQAIHYFDTAFGALLDELRASALLDRTVIAVYGDHQAFLSAERTLQTLPGVSLKTGYDYFRLRKRVPFLVRLPNGREAQTIDNPGGHLDIAPTLLALLGIESTGLAMLGRDLLEDSPRDVVFRDGSFAGRDRALVNRLGGIEDCMCFETSTGQETECAPLSTRRNRAMRELDTSDLIVSGNLVSEINAAQQQMGR